MAYTEFADAARLSDLDVTFLRHLGNIQAAKEHLEKVATRRSSKHFLAI